MYVDTQNTHTFRYLDWVRVTNCIMIRIDQINGVDYKFKAIGKMILHENSA